MMTQEVGLPALSVDQVTAVLPDDATAVSIADVETCSSIVATNITLLPRQPDIIMQDKAVDRPLPTFWGRYRPLPAPPCSVTTRRTDVAELVGTSVRYGARIATFRISPLTYSPFVRQLSFHTIVKVTIRYVAGTHAEGLYRDLPRAQRAALRGEVVNKAPLSDVPIVATKNTAVPDSIYVVHSTEPAKQEEIPYIVITSSALANDFAPLVEWRTSTGDTGRLFTVDWIENHYAGVDAANRLRNFIADALARWKTSYVLLGGDVEQVPHRNGFYDYATRSRGPTDLYFSGQTDNWNDDGDAIFGEETSFLEGDKMDTHPELWIGRVPASNSGEVKVFLNKVLTYEQNPPQYVESALLIGVSEFLPNNKEARDIDSDKYKEDTILPLMQNAGYHVDRLYDELSLIPTTPVLNRKTALDAIKQGIHIINHMDHSSVQTMGTGAKKGGGALTSADVDELRNGSKASIVWSVGCDPNAFDDESISEKWMNNPYGGAVAFVGNTRTGFWPSQSYQDEAFFRPWFAEGTRRIGELLAKTQGGYEYGSASMNLLGDPAMPVWLHQPTELTVTVPAALQTGKNSVPIVVEGLAGATEATVTFEKGDDNILVSRQTSAGKIAETLMLHTAGTLHVTVRAEDRLPWRGEIVVGASAASHVYVAGVQIDDAGSGNGNGNGRLEAGETADVRLWLGNGGSATSAAVPATLSTDSDGVTIVKSNAAAPAIVTGAKVSIVFTIALAKTFSDGDATSLDLAIDGIMTRIVIPVFAARLEQTHAFDRTPAPGETIAFPLHVINNGFGDAKGVEATLTTSSAQITVLDGTLVVGDVRAKDDADSAGSFRLRFGPTFDPSSDLVVLTMTDVLGNTTSQAIELRVPPAPQRLRTRSNKHQINVLWDPPPDRELRRYKIYRGVAGGTYAKFEKFLVRDASYYSDETATAEQTYSYRIAIVDSFGNESLPAETNAVATLDMHGGFPRPVNTVDGAIMGHITTRDVNSDGVQEIFALTARHQYETGALYAWKANGQQLIDVVGGDPAFAEFAPLDSGGQGAPAFGDLDGDGKTDIVVNGLNKIYAFKATGEPLVGWDNGVDLPMMINCTDRPTVYFTSPVIADLDGDKKPEILTTAMDWIHYCDGSNAHLFVFNASGTLIRHDLFSEANFSFGLPAIADLDGNGNQEAIFANQISDANGQPIRSDIYVLDDLSTLKKLISIDGATVDREIAIGDIDGDRRLDLVVASTPNNASHSLYAFHADGTPLAGWNSVDVEGGIAGPITLGDLDCDNALEVVVAGNQKVHVFENDGTPKTGWPVTRESNAPATSSASPLIVDVEGDADLDILLASTTTDGEGIIEAWDARTTLSVNRFPLVIDEPIDRTPAVADLDGDGQLEIIAGAREKLYVWESPGRNGRGLVSWPQVFRDGAHTNASPIVQKRGYLSTDPAECRLVAFDCIIEAEPFDDGCGCGCIAKPPPVGWRNIRLPIVEPVF